MGMGARMATHTDVLTLAQWFSPAFPVGAFAYSHGLEWAIDAGDVADADATRDWVETVLRHGGGWNDCILLACAYRAQDTDALAHVDATGRALASSRERLIETQLQGQAFCDAVSRIWPQTLDGLIYPVAVGCAAQRAGLPLDLTAQMFLQAFLSNLAAAATRLVPLGQTEGQTIIRTLTPLCSEIATDAVQAGLGGLKSSAFLSDIGAMKHETQYSRIFKT